MKPKPADDLVLVQLRMALACVALAVIGGAAAVLHYLPELSPKLFAAGLGLEKLRPVHTTFASVWIFGGCIAVVYHYLDRQGGGLGVWDRRRFWFHTFCWLAAGIGAVVTLLLGINTGREYLEFHPAISALLLAGWLAYLVTFLKRALPGFFGKPIYIWFWTVGTIYFVYTFVEAHAWLLPGVAERPLRDIQLHWKACGTLVGSFNFMVYGALVYVSERITGNTRYSQSPIAFWLFGVGCLNSFTNYVHHTYHLPQGHIVKWVAFVVSMMEVVILLRLIYDIRAMLSQRVPGTPFRAALGYVTSAKWWTAAMLAVAILISVPSLNSLIHGTKVVTGHAMGTELGIDSMILFGAIAFLLADLAPTRQRAAECLDRKGMRRHLALLNLAMAVLVLWLTASGLAHGISRFHGEPSPDWVTWEQWLFPVTGGLLAAALLYLLAAWLPLLSRRESAALKCAEPSSKTI